MASLVGRVNIAVALVPSSSSIVVVSPTRRPSLLSYPRSVHRRRAPLSITIESSSRCPSPSPLRSRRRPSPSKHRRGAVMPSLAVESTSRRLSPSRHVVHRHHRHRCHRRLVAVADIISSTLLCLKLCYSIVQSTTNSLYFLKL